MATPADRTAADRTAADRTAADRTGRLRTALAAAGLDALVVSAPASVAWLTGFTGSAGTVVVTATDLVLVTDGRYPVQAARQAPDAELVLDRDTEAAVATVLAGVPGPARVGVETHVVTVERYTALTAALGERAPDVDPVPTERLVEELRRVKDDDEVAAITRACAVSVEALTALVDGALGPLSGRSERRVVRDLEALLLDAGADAVAFPTIVAGGPHSASPHHEATDRLLEVGDLVVVDFGARVDGYCADMTRTLFVAGPGGAVPDGWQREVHALVARANAAGRAAAVPGAPVADVDAAAREPITAAGHGEHFPHGLGHGIGRDVHELPLVRRVGAGNLAAGEVVTVEPGVYLTGRGGVRIEDTVLVRDSAAAPEVLTAMGRDLLPVR